MSQFLVQQVQPLASVALIYDVKCLRSFPFGGLALSCAGVPSLDCRSSTRDLIQKRKGVWRTASDQKRRIDRAQGPEPCRFFDFGPKPYAKHPFVFESGPSWKIYSRAKGHPHKREAASKSEFGGSARHRVIDAP